MHTDSTKQKSSGALLSLNQVATNRALRIHKPWIAQILAAFGLIGAFIGCISNCNPVFAQSVTPAFSIVTTPSGMVAVSLTSGRIIYCTHFVVTNRNGFGISSANPIGSCATIGYMTPVPTASTLSFSVAAPSVYIVNTASGHLIECAVIDNVSGTAFGGDVSSAFGTCKDKGDLLK